MPSDPGSMGKVRLLGERPADTDSVSAMGTFLTRTAITFAASGDNTIVSAVANQIIQVYRIFFVVTATTNVTIKDGAGTALTGAMPLAANGALTLDTSGDPWFVTS